MYSSRDNPRNRCLSTWRMFTRPKKESAAVTTWWSRRSGASDLQLKLSWRLRMNSTLSTLSKGTNNSQQRCKNWRKRRVALWRALKWLEQKPRQCTVAMRPWAQQVRTFKATRVSRSISVAAWCLPPLLPKTTPLATVRSSTLRPWPTRLRSRTTKICSIWPWRPQKRKWNHQCSALVTNRFTCPHSPSPNSPSSTSKDQWRRVIVGCAIKT